MKVSDIKSLWVCSGEWDLKLFLKLFGEIRGRDLAGKFRKNNDVISFLCRECSDKEIEALLRFSQLFEDDQDEDEDEFPF